MISVTILTKDSEKHLKKVLEKCQSFDEVIVLDNGSVDGTLEIASSFKNVKIYKEAFCGFGPLHNLAVDYASNEWILSLDSDEVLSDALIAEIQAKDLDKKSIYSFSMRNYYNGRWIKACGWHPDRHLRLFNRQSTRFSNDFVHEKVIQDGLEEVRLEGHLLHYSYDSIEDFLRKMQAYSKLFAEQNCGKKSSSLMKAILHGLFAFFKSYILKRGIFFAYEGFVISIYQANTAFYKYLKLYEANKKVGL